MARKRYVRSLSLFLALLMIFSLFPVKSIAYAAEEVPTGITLVPADEPGTAGGTEDAASDEGSEVPLLSATLTEETEPQASEESADSEQNTGSEETGETETSEATQTVTEPTEQTPTDTTQDVQESDNTPTENPPEGGNGEGGNQHADVTPSDPEESAEGSGEPAEGSGEPVIDQSKRGVDFQFYKSDVQYNSWYYLHMLSPMVPDTTPFGSLVNSEITLDSICRINEQDAVNAFDHVWFADSEKSINGMLPEKVLETIGAWNINANFTVHTFILSQNEQDIAQYFLLLFQENGSELIRYALISSNMQMELRDLTILFDQYAAYRDYPVFVDSEDLNHDEIVVLRDVFRENLECIAFGAMPAADFSKVNVDLAGPQLVIVPEEGGEAGGEGTEQGTEPGNENPTEPGTKTPTEPGTENPTEPGSETPTEPSTENPTEPSSETPAETGAGTNDGTTTEDPKEPGETPTGETQTGETGETPLEGDDNQKQEPTGETGGDNTSDQTGETEPGTTEEGDGYVGPENPDNLPTSEPQEGLQEDTPIVSMEDIQEGIAEAEHGDLIQERDTEDLLTDDQLLPETKMLLDKGLRTLRAPALLGAGQTPVTADGITIEKVLARWLSSSTGSENRADFDPLVLAPTSDIAPNQQWQIDFALSGTGTVNAGAIELVIPAYIWKDRDGKEPGRLTLAIPQEPDTSNDFAWKRVGDTIVITNTHALSAASKYMVQGTFRMTYPDPNSDLPFDTTYAHQMVDIDAVDSTAEYQGVSDEFYGVLNIVTPRTNEVLTMTSNSIHATFNTYITADRATEAAVGDKVYFSKPSGLPETFTPANPDDYIYVQWYIDGRANGNQPFTMTFSDTVSGTAYKRDATTGEYSPVTVDGLMLGATYTADGTVVSTDNKTVTGKLYEGYSTVDKSAYVWVAFPKSAFSEEGATYRVTNAHVVTVTGKDDQVTTTAEGSGSIEFRMPIIWKVDKVWKDDNNAAGHRPDDINVWIENHSVTPHRTVHTAQLSDANNWHTEYVDDGTISNYEAYEVSYYVSQSNVYHFANGYGDWIEYENGARRRLHWWYERERTDYDESTHTWTFTNVYKEMYEWTYTTSLSVNKFASSHTDSRDDSTSDRELQTLRKGLDSNQISFSLSTSSYCLPHTVAEGGSADDVSTHGKRYVTLELEDTSKFFEARGLNDDDYDIVSVRLRSPEASLWVPMAGSTEGEGSLNPTDSPELRLYGSANGTDWTQYATLSNGEITTMNGAANAGMTVTFPGNGVKYTKTTLRTNVAYVAMGYYVNMVLHPTAAIQNDIEMLFASTDYAKGRLFNNANAVLYDSNDAVVLTLGSRAPAYLHGRNYRMAPDLGKSIEFVESDRTKRILRFTNTIQLDQASNITIRNEYNTAYRDRDLPVSKEGTFYDLLPAGMNVDLNSIALTKGRVIKTDIVPNYQGSGRQLLIVQVELDQNTVYRNGRIIDEHYGDSTYPVSGYVDRHILTFDMTYLYEEASSRGLTGLRNHAAYEAAEPDFGNQPNWIAEPDDPTGGNHKESSSAVAADARQLMTNLDPNRDDPVFVYAGANVSATELDFSALTDIRKHVQVAGSDMWSYGLENEVNVYEGGKYTYKIQLTSGTDTTSRDMIILDSIENYVLKPDDNDYSETSPQWSWHGTFQSVDVSELEAMGIQPVVYYNTTSNLDFSNLNTDNRTGVVAASLNGNGWTTTMPADPASVKAIAIDCRFRPDGSDFELSEKQSIIVYVHMKAPTWFTSPEAFNAEEYTDFLKNAHAYNNVFMDVTQKDDLGMLSHSYNHFDYTKIGIIGADLLVEKEWDDMDDNDRVRPPEVTAYLYANGENTGKTLILNADGDWKGVFKHVAKFDEDGSPIVYTLVDEVEEYTCSSEMIDNKIILTNTYEPKKIKVPFTKLWESDEPDGWQTNIPASIAVRLYCNGIYTGKRLVVRQALDGTWSGSFDDLLKYNQGLENVYTIDEEPLDNFIKTVDGYTITNRYYPYGDLSVEKHVTNGTPASLATIFHYTLTLQTASGKAVPGKFNYTIYDGNGDPVSSDVIGNGDEFDLMDNWKLVVKDVPSSTVYRVIENDAPGFTLVSSDNASGRITPSATAEAVFTNNYSANGQMTLNALKELTGRTLERYQFKFRVLNEGGTVVRAAANQLDGTITFGAIRYTQADDGREYTYTSQETAGENAGYQFDDSVYTIKVTPHDNGDGTMTCTPVYYNADNEQIDQATFTNAYHAEGDLTLRAWKVLSQRALQDGEFTFELLDEEDNVLQTKTNSADGSIVFDPIHYDETDIDKQLLYFVREKEGSDTTVIYDESEFGYEIQVIDNGDGTLSFSQGFVDTSNRYIECEDCNGLGYDVNSGVNYNFVVFQVVPNSPDDGTYSYKFTYHPDGMAYNQPSALMIETNKRQISFSTAGSPTTIEADGTVTNGLHETLTISPLTEDEMRHDIKLYLASGAIGIVNLDSALDTVELSTNTYANILICPICDTCSGEGYIMNPDWEPIASDDLPVFTNTLKPGKLSVTKQVTADDPSLIDPTQEFHFKVKLIGPDVQDGEMEYDLEQVEPYQATP